MKKYLLIMSFCCFAYTSQAQYAIMGQDLPSTQWNLIDTRQFRILFPRENEKQALEAGQLLHEYLPRVSWSLKCKPKKIKLILHNQNAMANGWVAWAPRRSEYLLIPYQSTYSQPWLDQLAIHETRHWMQMQKIQTRFTKILYLLFGERATAVIAGLQVPRWFLEGDAVCTETALTQTGRGRTPDFSMGIKAQLADKKIYNYHKANFGSFKDFTPNAYEFGYQMVGNMRKTYGTFSTGRVFGLVGGFGPALLSFQVSLKITTGKWMHRLYFDQMDTLRIQWKVQYDSSRFASYNPVNINEKGYVNYHFPAFLDDSTLIANKTSYNDIARIVKIGQGTEEVICTPGMIQDYNFCAGNGKISWCELFFTRFEQNTYSDIIVYDAKENSKKRLTYKERYFTPALSGDGKMVAAIRYDESINSSIDIFDSSTGEALYAYQVPEGQMALSPSFSDDQASLVILLLNKEGKGLFRLDLKSGKYLQILPYSKRQIEYPLEKNGYIFYTADYNGTTNIYAFSLITNTLYQVTNSRFGVGPMAFNSGGKQMFFTNYTADGYKVCKIAVNPGEWSEFNMNMCYHDALADTLSAQENAYQPGAEVPMPEMKAESYSKIEHVFDFHGWTPPLISVLENGNPAISLNLVSQNDLSTCITEIGLLNAQGVKQNFVRFSYLGWYPVLNFEGSSTRIYQLWRNIQDTISGNRGKDTASWTENRASASIDIPIVSNSGTFSQRIDFIAGLNFLNVTDEKHIPYSEIDIWMDTASYPKIFMGYYKSMEYSLIMQNQKKTARNSVYPRWAQILRFSYNHTPFDGTDLGSLFTAEGTFYFPGLFLNDGLKMYLGYSNCKTKRWNRYVNMYYYNSIQKPRGYSFYQLDDPGNIYSASLTYKFPLAYPDVSIPGIIYMKRIKTALFYDVSKVKVSETDYYGTGYHTAYYDFYYSSFGTEMTSDVHFFNLLVPFDIGVRAGLKPSNYQWRYFVEFMLSLNLNL